MNKTLSLAAILDRLGHEELEYKKLGDYGTVNGIRISIVQIMKLADEHPPTPPTNTELLVT